VGGKVGGWLSDLRGARRGAARWSRRRPRTSTRPARPGPGADGGTPPSSKIGVGQGW